MTAELHRLDVATEACLEQVSSSIAELTATLDRRKAQLLEQVTQASQAKRQVLEEQLALVAAEKQKVSAAARESTKFTHWKYLSLQNRKL